MTWSKDLIESITDIGELEAKLRFDRRLTQQMRALCEKFPMSVTRYYLSLIAWSDMDDPIRRMCIPTFLETDMSGEFDTSDEESNTVCQGVSTNTPRVPLYSQQIVASCTVGIASASGL